MNSPKYLTFEGGGVLGAAYGGVIRSLEENNILKNIEGFAGTSAGSIVAGALACGGNADFIENTLKSMDYKLFKDSSYLNIYNINRVRTKYGWYKGDAFYNWFSDKLNELTNNSSITLGEIKIQYGKDFYGIAYNIDTLKEVKFSPYLTPDAELRDVVRMSMSIPGFFASYIYNGDRYIDGGLTNNYPLNVWDDERYTNNKNDHNKLFNPHALGFKLITEDEKNEELGIIPRVSGPIDFTEKVINILYNQAQKIHVKKNDWKRTVPIFCKDISSIDFNITNDQNKWLINQGKTATDEYLRTVSSVHYSK